MTASASEGVEEPTRRRWIRVLGPGLIAGASDDDPSGIATYTQAGAQFGYAMAWTLLLSYPLMVAIQIVSARIGRTTGAGIARNLRQHYPNWIAYAGVSLLIVANTINLGADIGAMAEATRLIAGGPQALFVVAFGAVCGLMPVVLKYRQAVAVLKWLTLSLFAYVATLLFVKVEWTRLAAGLVSPRIAFDRDAMTVVVAVLGTTISPYLFFWQASQEVEETRADPRQRPLKRAPDQAEDAHARIRLDTIIGMGFSNLIALAIMATAAATLNVAGETKVGTAAAAAAALKPLAGPFAEALFALGVVGTGLLAAPVLSGSAAYGIGEALRWPTGLDRAPGDARAFYAAIVAATAAGVLLNLTPIDPIAALFWSAVVNGVIAVPIMALMMAMASNPRVMGPFTIGPVLKTLGWLSTAAMAAAAAGMIALSS